MKRKLSKRLRSIIGISLTLGVFAFILLALNSWLGWPTSLLTLGGMLGIAWFVSMFAGEYDIVTRIEVDSLRNLSVTVFGDIRNIPGVTATKTLIVF